MVIAVVCRFPLRLVYEAVRKGLNRNDLIQVVFALPPQNPPLRPVLKHGPRSLSYVQVIWC